MVPARFKALSCAVSTFRPTGLKEAFGLEDKAVCFRHHDWDSVAYSEKSQDPADHLRRPSYVLSRICGESLEVRPLVSKERCQLKLSLHFFQDFGHVRALLGKKAALVLAVPSLALGPTTKPR